MVRLGYDKFMIIETERLVLREVDPERDFDGWAKAMADEDTVRYLGTAPMGRAQAWRSMAMVIGHWSIKGYGFFSLEHKETGQWVGRVGPVLFMSSSKEMKAVLEWQKKLDPD